MALTADEQRELDQLEYDKLVAQKHDLTAAAVEAPAAAEPAAKEWSPTAPDKYPEAGQVMDASEADLDKAGGTGVDRALKKFRQQGWENMSPSQRFDYLLLRGPSAAAEVLGGVGKGAEGIAERSIPTVLGQLAGRVTRIPGMDRVGGALGAAGGEALAELREGGDFKPGAIGGAALSGLITGKPLAGAGAKDILKEGGKYAATNVASKVLETEVDEGRLPTAGETATAGATGLAGAGLAKLFSKPSAASSRPALYDMEMDTLRDLRKEGVVIPPHEIGAGSETLASFGGKAALGQEAAKRNQFVWQKLAREEVGLSKEALPISEKDLLEVRRVAAAPYREIQTIQTEAKDQLAERLRTFAKMDNQHEAMIAMDQPAMKESLSILGTLAEADVDALKKARDAAQRSKKAFFNGDPNAYEPWQAAKTESGRLEDAIERAAASLKDDTLLKRLKESRTQIAETYSVEDSLNPGNGFVDPVSFGRQLLNGEPLTGNLEKMAKFQLAFRRAAVESGRVPAPGVGNLGAMATTAMASRGDVPGAVGGLLNMTVGRAARPILLSDMVQDGMLTPKQRQNFAALLARYMAENAPESRAVWERERANAQSEEVSTEQQ